MSMRTSSLLLAAALAGCNASPDKPDNPDTPEQAAVAPGAAAIDCAVRGQPLARRCAVEQGLGPNGAVLTLRQPDGGFHRLAIARDGRGVIAADGAEAARVQVLGADRIEVAIGDARYRLPATIATGAR